MVLSIASQAPMELLALGAVAWLARSRGGEPEQVAAIGLIAAATANALSLALFGAVMEVGPQVLAGEIWLTGWFTCLAVHANRGWPLWLGALALVRLLATLADLSGNPFHDAGLRMLVAATLPAQIAGLALGIAVHARREARIGRYPGWRPRLDRRPR